MATKIQQILENEPNTSLLFGKWLSRQGLDSREQHVSSREAEGTAMPHRSTDKRYAERHLTLLVAIYRLFVGYLKLFY